MKNNNAIIGLSALMLASGMCNSANAEEVEDAVLTSASIPSETAPCSETFNGLSYATGDMIVCPAEAGEMVNYINKTGAFGTIEHIGKGLLCQVDVMDPAGEQESFVELHKAFMVARSGHGFIIVDPDQPSIDFMDQQDRDIEKVAHEYIGINRRVLSCASKGQYLGF